MDLLPTCGGNVFDVYINGEPLEFNNDAKYLGLTIDQHQLKYWKDTLNSLFNAFVKSYVDYQSLTLRGVTNTHLLKLKQTLNKAMRIMAFRSMNQVNSYTFTTKCYHLKQT